MDIWDKNKHPRKEIEQKLEKFKGYQKWYRSYPGSPYDDARLNLGVGYTVKDEKSYINRQVRMYKAALKFMDEKGKEEITDREIYYLVY